MRRVYQAPGARALTGGTAIVESPACRTRRKGRLHLNSCSRSLTRYGRGSRARSRAPSWS
ncbi:hypothetical protein DF3PA_50046 [Candidatus Defluviicoccus seviourii]|uniref:Uncharacterized protein n=1 Tax=Candidatus Defluviicoccus seviourii TaxID=2565273 RepID=A0A564WHD8_9PROT|nr:hypothetical protein DF3PA_50046 [Candidatus Defluviicoccus seviourii]